MAAGIREKQTVALKRMLNFNVPPIKNSTGEPVWKVLIYDRFGQDIISPLLSVKELRDMGITLHLLLHSDRDPIPDVPAVYFVMPTEENIDRMCQDLRNQLYESYYLNFISAISRSKLEDIANAALGASAVTQVAKVFDQYLNFITLEDDMFVLCNQNKELISYRAINRPDITDTEMEAIMDTVVDSLFCFFVTLAILDDDPAYVVRFKNTFTADLTKLKEGTNVRFLKIATALNPRFKNLRGMRYGACFRSLKRTTLRCGNYRTEPPKKKINLLLVASDSDVENEYASVRTALDRYRAEPIISMDACPLQGWLKREGTYESLKDLACKYLVAPATTVPCKHLLSLSSDIVNKKRAALSPANVNKLICLSDWLNKN